MLNCCYGIKLESDWLILNVRPTLQNLGLLGWGCFYASKPGHKRLNMPMDKSELKELRDEVGLNILHSFDVAWVSLGYEDNWTW